MLTIVGEHLLVLLNSPGASTQRKAKNLCCTEIVNGNQISDMDQFVKPAGSCEIYDK